MCVVAWDWVRSICGVSGHASFTRRIKVSLDTMCSSTKSIAFGGSWTELIIVAKQVYVKTAPNIAM